MNTGKNTQKIMSRVSLTKEAHMIEQTDQPSPDTDISEKGTHLAVTHAKAVTRGGEVGPANPMGRPNLDHAFCREARSYPPKVGCKCFHIYGWREPTSRTINRASLTPSQDTHHQGATPPFQDVVV